MPSAAFLAAFLRGVDCADMIVWVAESLLMRLGFRCGGFVLREKAVKEGARQEHVPWHP